MSNQPVASPKHRQRPAAAIVVLALGAAAAYSCKFDKSDRWELDRASSALQCTEGHRQCGASLQLCVPNTGGGTEWVAIDECSAKGLVCSARLLACTACHPDERTCDGHTVKACKSDGSGTVAINECDTQKGLACRGGVCANLCLEARGTKSNVGCEYWAADLDNANINPTSNAAAQQFAVVLSNPQSDLPADVVIEQDDALPGQTAQVRVVASAQIPPNNLRVFKLGPREVDGSPPGQFDTGPGTALTRQAYRVRSHVPVVAYQFNPLDNVAVFSNDASLLKPAEALTYTPGVMEPAYLVVGWPQTIAHTDDPNTNFNPAAPIDLRSFVTIVGTRPDTRVRFTSSARVIPGVDIPELQAGDQLDVTLQPFEVLNLETGGFNADFTGSLIEADQPIVVFSGGEASDAPYFSKLADRFCCADHLEEQLDPIRTAGTSFFAVHAPNRTRAVANAGAELAIVEEPEYFRIVAVDDGGPTRVTTTLEAPDNEFILAARGSKRDITSTRDFTIESDRPVFLGVVQASQDAAGVRRGLPGGDPSFVIMPPREQYRPDYTFLTPDKYAFDFLVIAAPSGAVVRIDGRDITEYGCETAPADGLTDEQRGGQGPMHLVHRCQLSFPVIDRSQENLLLPGVQNDGVHRVESDSDVMVIVYGFDAYVSYAYAAGTRLESLTIR